MAIDVQEDGSKEFHDTLMHKILDIFLLACILTNVWYFELGNYLLQGTIDFISNYPDHYEPVFDFISTPMSPPLAVTLWIIDMYFLLKTYYLEKRVVMNAHKKVSFWIDFSRKHCYYIFYICLMPYKSLTC